MIEQTPLAYLYVVMIGILILTTAVTVSKISTTYSIRKYRPGEVGYAIFLDLVILVLALSSPIIANTVNPEMALAVGLTLPIRVAFMLYPKSTRLRLFAESPMSVYVALLIFYLFGLSVA